MLELEDRLLRHTCKLAFLSDFIAQPHPHNHANMELSEDGRYGLSFLLWDIHAEAQAIRELLNDLPASVWKEAANAQ